MRSRKEVLLEKRVRLLKLLGTYIGVVLLIFAIVVPLLGRNSAERKPPPAALQVLKEDSETPLSNSLPENRPDSAETGKNHPEQAETKETSSERAESKAASPEPQESVKKDSAAKAAVQTSATQNPAPPAQTDKAPEQATAAKSLAETTLKSLPVANLDNIVWPLQGEITQKYGLAYSATYADYRFHSGIDIKGEEGAIVRAALPGKVIELEVTRQRATVISIDHGAGLVSTYAHLGSGSVQKGMTVKAGQAIGTVGQLGLDEVADDPHLHFILTRDGQYLDPLEYLPELKK